jgi:hypothetical protein
VAAVPSGPNWTRPPTIPIKKKKDEWAAHSLFKILSPGPVFYGTKWLLWCPHKQRHTFNSKCRIDKGSIKRGSTIDHWRSQYKGRFIAAHPLCIHSTYNVDGSMTVYMISNTVGHIVLKNYLNVVLSMHSFGQLFSLLDLIHPAASKGKCYFIPVLNQLSTMLWRHIVERMHTSTYYWPWH